MDAYGGWGKQAVEIMLFFKELTDIQSRVIATQDSGSCPAARECHRPRWGNACVLDVDAIADQQSM